jgi:hypothetical protein
VHSTLSCLPVLMLFLVAMPGTMPIIQCYLICYLASVFGHCVGVCALTREHTRKQKLIIMPVLLLLRAKHSTSLYHC